MSSNGGQRMDVLYSLEYAKDQLQEVMRRKVSVLRHLLISLHDEHHAIVARNQGMLDHVIEERLGIISAFEGWSQEFVTLVQHLAFEVEVPCSYSEALRYCEALEILHDCLDSEDVEILFLQRQVKSLVDQINHQNGINAGRLREGHFHVTRSEAYGLILASPSHKPKAKSAVGLMEID